jgi:hypothetical protein
VAEEYSTAVSFIGEEKLHQNAQCTEMAAGKGLKEGFSNAKDWKRFSTLI